MRQIIYHPQPALIAWVCGKLQMRNPGPASAIGVVNERGIIAAALFHNQHDDPDGKPFMIEISFVAIDKRWSTRSNIKTILSYPFNQLGVKRLQAITAKTNLPARRFLEHLGFKLEGIARHGWPQGGHAACYSMLRRECLWLEDEPRGKISTICASSAGPGSNIGSANAVEQGNRVIQLRA